MPRPELNLTREHTALIVNECQNGVVGANSAVPAVAAAAAPVLPVIGRVARAARKAGVPVVHLTYVPAFNGKSFNDNTPLQQRISGVTSGWTADDRDTQVADEIGVEATDLILPRQSGMSPTHGTQIFAILRNIGVSTVVLTGVSLNVAIQAAAIELADEDFNVVVPRDTVAGTPPEYAESVLRHSLRFLATITTSDDVIAAWS